MKKMADSLFKEFDDNLRPLLELGLDYLTLSRNGNSLSTGETAANPAGADATDGDNRRTLHPR